MPRCKTCKHWTQRTQYEHIPNEGTCCPGVLTYEMVTIELHTGWDGGYVEKIETNEKFGCVLHEVQE